MAAIHLTHQQSASSSPHFADATTSHYHKLKAAIAEAHPPTAEHSVRVRICATNLGLTCQLTGRELSKLLIAAELHDIGKLHVPTSVLDKPGTLSEDEWSVIKEHPSIGADIVALAFPTMPEVADCILYHHERLDGSGYPNGLKGNEMPFLARLIAVSDAFAALTEDRPFRLAYTDEEAFQILTVEEEGKYDLAFLEMLACPISLQTQRTRHSVH